MKLMRTAWVALVLAFGAGCLQAETTGPDASTETDGGIPSDAGRDAGSVDAGPVDAGTSCPRNRASSTGGGVCDLGCPEGQLLTSDDTPSYAGPRLWMCASVAPAAGTLREGTTELFGQIPTSGTSTVLEGGGYRLTPSPAALLR